MTKRRSAFALLLVLGCASAEVVTTREDIMDEAFDLLIEEGAALQHGISYTNDGGVHIVAADLCAAGVRLRASSPSDGFQTTTAFARSVNAVAAINGDWPGSDSTLGRPEYAPPSNGPRSLAVGNGEHFPGTRAVGHSFLAVGHNRVETRFQGFARGDDFVPGYEPDATLPAPWMEEVVSGAQTMVYEGEAIDYSAADAMPGRHCARAERSAIAFNADRTKMMFISAVGRMFNCSEFSRYLASIEGIDYAQLQDSGSSTTLYVRGTEAFPGGQGFGASAFHGNLPRVNHLALVSDGQGPPRHCAERGLPMTGTIRHVTSFDVFTSWGLRAEDATHVTAEELGRFVQGPGFSSPRDLLRDASGAIYALEGGVARHLSPNAAREWRVNGGWRDGELGSVNLGAPLPSEVRLLAHGDAIYVFDDADHTPADPPTSPPVDPPTSPPADPPTDPVPPEEPPTPPTMEEVPADDIPVPGDFDGDGAANFAVFRPSTGEWFVHGDVRGSVVFGQRGDVPFARDFNGDGAEDLVIYRPAAPGRSATWHIRTYAGEAIGSPTAHGEVGDVPVPGDFDGNGVAELAVWRPSTGEWFVSGRAEVVVWGQAGDIPMTGDVDGDGRDDLVVYRPGAGGAPSTWWSRSADGLHLRQNVTWGRSGDIVVGRDRRLGDFDGNGTSDFAVFRPSDGKTYVEGVVTLTGGDAGDWVFALDFDADGESDAATYRPGSPDATWHVQTRHREELFDPGVPFGRTD